MVATAIYSVTMVLWKETAFPLQNHGKPLEKECCLPCVFCDSGYTPANLLCELNGHLMPCTSCLYGKSVDVCTGQFGVFVYLVLRCLLGCCTWFSCCAANVGLSICAPHVTSQAIGFPLAHGKRVVPSGRLLFILLKKNEMSPSDFFL